MAVLLPAAPVDDTRPLDMQSIYQRVTQPPLAAFITLGRLGDAVAVTPLVQLCSRLRAAPASRSTRLRVAISSPAAQDRAGDSTCIWM